MLLSDPSALSALQRRSGCIRNVCIIAHVDHGKTSLSDHLLSSNGVISRALAGKARFLDSRPDEQERKITMKSSSIALLFHDKRKADRDEQQRKTAATAPAPPPAVSPPAPAADASPVASSSPAPSDLIPTPSSPASDSLYLINLIDSPGHVDFSSEVSTAVRCSDGALLLVDVIEGLQVQTSAVMRQAWREGVRPVLVLNKMDRLMLEVKMTAAEAFQHLLRLLETVNAVASTFITSDAMTAAAAASSSSSASTLVDIDDEKQVIFSPELGNVLFCSAHDGWAFSIADFAALYSRLLGMKQDKLQLCLWGDYYYIAKDKKVQRKPVGKSSRPMAVQLVFEVLWQVYDAVMSTEGGDDAQSVEKLIAMMERLGVQLSSRELLREKDRRRRLQLVMQRWLPVSNCVLGTVVDKLPSPVQAQSERLERVWSGELRRRESEAALRDAMLRCDRDYSDVVLFVSKMVDYGDVLSTMRRNKQHGTGSVGQRRAYVRGRVAETAEVKELTEEKEEVPVVVQDGEPDKEARESAAEESSDDSQRFLGFARIFAGTLDTSSPTQRLHVYLPRYHPSSAQHHVTVMASSLSL